MIRLVTDSASNVPRDIQERYNIEIIPLNVMFGSESYKEDIDITADEFLERLPNADPMPTTSQPSPSDFEAAFRPIIEAGDEIICIVLSQDLSGTYNSAYNAAQTFDNPPISLIDSRSISAGATMMLVAAGRMIEAGYDRQQVVDEILKMTQQIELVLTLDTLEYLKRGGRIGGAQAFIGGLLKIKPTIMIKDGALAPGERTRSRKKALRYIVDKYVAQFGDQPLWIGVAQAEAEDASELEHMLQSELNVKELIRCVLGPVILTHTGPAVLGAAALPAPEI